MSKSQEQSKNIWGKVGEEIPDNVLLSYLHQYEPKIMLETVRWSNEYRILMSAEDVRQEIIVAMIEFARRQYRDGKELFYPRWSVKHQLMRCVLKNEGFSKTCDTKRFRKFYKFNKEIRASMWNVILHNRRLASDDDTLQDDDINILTDINVDIDWDSVDTIIDFKSILSSLPEIEQKCVVMTASGFSGREVKRRLNISRRTYDKIMNKVRYQLSEEPTPRTKTTM